MGQRRPLAVLALIVSALAGGMVAGASPAQAAPVDYVALGDSYSSGVGTPGASGSCLRSPQGYPQLWVDTHEVSSFADATCSGAKTADVRADQISSLSSETDLVTITIGGNDVGFADTMLTCTLGTTKSCLEAVDDAREYAETTLPGDLDVTYAAIRDQAPAAQVHVLGYPRLFAEGACPGGLTLAKRQAINDAADELASIIAERVAAAGFSYVDVRRHFAGHGVCTATAWINAFTLTVDSYHPNTDGYSSGYLPALTAVTG
jgi:lysophospholipase L1-like esterase